MLGEMESTWWSTYRKGMIRKEESSSALSGGGLLCRPQSLEADYELQICIHFQERWKKAEL